MHHGFRPCKTDTKWPSTCPGCRRRIPQHSPKELYHFLVDGKSGDTVWHNECAKQTDPLIVDQHVVSQ